MEDISDAEYMHAKRVYKGSEVKTSGEYHDSMFNVIHY